MYSVHQYGKITYAHQIIKMIEHHQYIRNSFSPSTSACLERREPADITSTNYFLGGLIRSAIPTCFGSTVAMGFSGCEIRRNLVGVQCAMNMCQQHYQQRKARTTCENSETRAALAWVRFKTTTLSSLGTSALPNELYRATSVGAKTYITGATPK